MFGADPQTVADAEIIVLWGSPVGSAAESSGATIASAYDALNGPDHDVDLAESGYLRGAFHLDPAGGMVVAEALAAEGFDPTAAP